MGAKMSPPRSLSLFRSHLSAHLGASLGALLLGVSLLGAACTDPPRSGSGNGSSSMSSFDKSLAAFKGAVASDTGVAAASLNVTPGSDKVIGHTDFEVPGFVPFLAQVPGHPAVAGWGKADGTAVTLKRQNFGSILEAMGFADAASTFSAVEQAKRVAWAHVGYAFVAEYDFKGLPVPPGGGPPQITRDGGVTKLTFFMIESGDTGSMFAVKCVIQRDAQGTYTYSLARA